MVVGVEKRTSRNCVYCVLFYYFKQELKEGGLQEKLLCLQYSVRKIDIAPAYWHSLSL